MPPYNRYLQIVEFEAFIVANIWPESLGAFGKSYEAGKGTVLARQIDELLTKKLEQPLLFAADFNIENISVAFPQLMQTFGLQEALSNEPTKPHGGHPDHILFSPEWHKIESGIIKTQSDHYLCWAEFEK